MTVEERDGIEVLTFADTAQWEAWLAEHHELPGGVYLKIAKKDAAATTLTVREALDVALCFGWIDSVRKSYDDEYYLQKYSRRRRNGSWSKINVDKVAVLLAAGRMREPGLAEVAAAKADGRWDAAYEPQATATMPPDLVDALEASPPAKEFYAGLDKSTRYFVIMHLAKARTPQVRAARLETMVTRMAAGRGPR